MPRQERYSVHDRGTRGDDGRGGVHGDRSHRVQRLERRLYRSRSCVKEETGGGLTTERPGHRTAGVGGNVTRGGDQLFLANHDRVGVGEVLVFGGVGRDTTDHRTHPTGRGDDGEGGYRAIHHHQRLFITGIKEGNCPGGCAVVSGAGVGHVDHTDTRESREGSSHADIVYIPCQSVGGYTSRRRLTQTTSTILQDKRTSTGGDIGSDVLYFKLSGEHYCYGVLS